MSRKPKPPSLLRRFRRLFSFKRHYRRRLNRRYIVEGMQLLNDVLADSPLAGRYFLCGGALLSCIRNGCVNADDPDVDFYVRAEDTPRLLASLPSLERAGFQRWYRFVNNGGEVTEWSLKRGTVKFEFFRLFPHADRLRYYCYTSSEQGLLELPEMELGTLAWLDRQWLKPANHDAYLAAEYGDWKVPWPDYCWTVDSPAVVAMEPWQGTWEWESEIPPLISVTPFRRRMAA
jgi:hypothetical protein